MYLGPDENCELCTALESPATIGRTVVTQQNTVEHSALKYGIKLKRYDHLRRNASFIREVPIASAIIVVQRLKAAITAPQ